MRGGGRLPRGSVLHWVRGSRLRIAQSIAKKGTSMARLAVWMPAPPPLKGDGGGGESEPGSLVGGTRVSGLPVTERLRWPVGQAGCCRDRRPPPLSGPLGGMRRQRVEWPGDSATRCTPTSPPCSGRTALARAGARKKLPAAGRRDEGIWPRRCERLAGGARVRARATIGRRPFPHPVGGGFRTPERGGRASAVTEERGCLRGMWPRALGGLVGIFGAGRPASPLSPTHDYFGACASAAAHTPTDDLAAGRPGAARATRREAAAPT